MRAEKIEYYDKKSHFTFTYLFFFSSFLFRFQAKKSPTDGNEIQLTSTKENLKSFIERWEEHPNSPYIFDANSSLILPIQDNEKNTSSGFSSRGCSPSPCESLSSNTELFQNGTSPDSAVPNSGDLDNNIDFDMSTIETEHNEQKDSGTATAEMSAVPTATSASAFERPNSSASVDRRRSKSKQEYLQSFDRRHSDSNYVINQSSSSLEKLNLAEEIKKLSERLMVLSSISDELMEFNKRYEENRKQKLSSSSANTDDATAAKVQTNRSSEALKNMKNASSFNCSTKTEKISNKLIHSKSLLSENEIQAATSMASKQSTNSSSSSAVVVNDLTQRLRTLNEIPCVFERVINGNGANGIGTETTETTTATVSFPIGMQRLKSTSVSTDSSNSTSPCTFGSVPWPITNRRTKFNVKKISQLSRDVPYGSPDSHRTIFLEEAANTTKDCLLQLLDKYNDKKETRICSIRRHQSIAVGNGMTDNLEYHSMNSINTFFKRNVFQQNGNTVRKIKARIESKH